MGLLLWRLRVLLETFDTTRLQPLRTLALMALALCALAPTRAVHATPFAADTRSARPVGHFTDPQELEALLDEVIGQQMAVHHLPGAQVAVVQGGRLFFAKGYGYADIARHTPMRVDTLFRVGSVSKLITWTAVMQLVEQGKLDLHADVNTYLRHVQMPSTFASPITLGHLLTHTAGFEERELNGVMVVQDAAALRPLDQALAQALPARIYPPGEVAAYSNYGAALAAEIVAAVSGERFEQYVARHIFAPLEMAHSTFAQPVPPGLAHSRAVGYRADEDGALEVAEDRYVQLAPAGSLSTTAADMARFMIAHLEGGGSGGGQILRAATLEDMHRQHYTFDPRLPGITWGFFEGERDGVRTLWHGGNVDGFGSWLTLLPDEHVGIYVGFNGKSQEHARLAVIHAVIDRFAAAAASATVQPPAGWAERAAGFTGSFRSTRRAERTVQKLASYLVPANRVVAHSDGTLSVEGAGPGLADHKGTPKRWVEIGPRLFREVGGQATLAFRADAAGRITALAVSTFPFVVYERQAFYEQGLVQFGGLALAMLVLLATGAAWLVGALRRLVRRRPDVRTAVERHAQRLAGMVILIDGLLVLGVGIWLVTGNLAYRMPPLFYVTVALGVLSALGAGGMGVSAVWVWRRRAWHLGGRLLYTVLTLAALGVVAFLAGARLLGLHV